MEQELIINNNIKKLFISNNNEKYEEKINNTKLLIDNLCMLRNIMISKIKNNTYLYNHILFKNVISNYLCDFIINESEEYALKNISNENYDGWMRTRHKNYPTTDLPIKNIDTLFILVNNIIKYDIFPLIEKSYNVNKYFLECNDIFIVKYIDNKQNMLEKHKDGCAFSFNILLNSENNFEGGGTIIFENDKDILVKNIKGGLLLHSGQVFHSGNIITKGIRYILVGFISYLKGYDLINNNQKINKYIINTFDKETISNINFNSWNINLDNKYYENLDFFILNKKNQNGSYLLDTNKEKYNITEKIIYDLTLFHLKRLDLEIDFNRYKIEYWWKNDVNINNQQIIHNLHSDKDEFLIHSNNILKSPILSTVTYINDSKYPTLLTSTPEILLKENKIILNNGIILSFPKKMKHISFNGSNIHGVFNIFDSVKYIDNRKTLMFNIWDNYTPLKKDFYKFYDDNIINKNEKLLKLTITNNIFYDKIYLDELKMKILIQTIFNNSIDLNNYLYEYVKLNEIENKDIYIFDLK